MKCGEILSEEFIFLDITKRFLENEFRTIDKENGALDRYKARIPGMMHEISLTRRLDLQEKRFMKDVHDEIIDNMEKNRYQG